MGLTAFLIDCFMHSLPASAEEDMKRHHEEEEARTGLKMDSPESVWMHIQSGEL